jgi:multicomponent Na+:H+ antiporter subunit D
VNGAWLAEHYVIVAAFVLSTLLNIAYLLPPVMRAFLKPLPEGDSAAPVRIQEAPALCLIPLLVTAAGTLVLFVLADPALQMLKMGISS